MKAQTNELNWWIEPNGSTHTSTSESQVATRAVLATGKVYPESRSGVIVRIGDRPAQIGMVSRQLLDVLHSRFPGTRWWVRDPVPAHNQQPSAPAAS